MFLFDYVLFAFFAEVYLRPKWLSRFHKSWQFSPYIQLIYKKRNKRLMRLKCNLISTSLSLGIKMDADFEIFAPRNGKKFQEMSSLEN